MTAANADHAWELRCEVREKLLAWLREHHPDALPRTRVVFPDAGRPVEALPPGLDADGRGLEAPAAG